MGRAWKKAEAEGALEAYAIETNDGAEARLEKRPKFRRPNGVWFLVVPGREPKNLGRRPSFDHAEGELRDLGLL